MAFVGNDIEGENPLPPLVYIESQGTTIQHSLSNGNMAFLNQIERQAGVILPMYLKNLLILIGFDNAISFRRLNEDRLLSIENFAKKHLVCIAEPNDRLEEYFGIFHKCLLQFRILEGHKIMILELASQFKRDPDSFINLHSPSHESTSEYVPTIKRQRIIIHPSVVDLENEKHILLRMINNWIETNRANLADVHVVDIKVSSEECNDDSFDNLPQMIGFKAEITCPVCKKIFVTHKVKERSANNRRWITSNFQKHLKTSHFSDRNERFPDLIKEEPDDYSNNSLTQHFLDI